MYEMINEMSPIVLRIYILVPISTYFFCYRKCYSFFVFAFFMEKIWTVHASSATLSRTFYTQLSFWNWFISSFQKLFYFFYLNRISRDTADTYLTALCKICDCIEIYKADNEYLITLDTIYLFTFVSNYISISYQDVEHKFVFRCIHFSTLYFMFWKMFFQRKKNNTHNFHLEPICHFIADE